MNNYLKYRDQMDCFDVLCCEHRKWPYKWVGHTAVVYKNEAGQLMVLESTSLNKFSGIKGVQLTPLGLWLQHYNGKVYWRKWVWGPGVSGLENFKIRCDFDLFIRTYRGTSYPSGCKGARLLFKAWWDSPFLKEFSRNPATTSIIFCSHLVGMLFYLVKFAEECSIVPASELIPDDFREYDYIDSMTKQNMGHLAPEILIKG